MAYKLSVDAPLRRSLKRSLSGQIEATLRDLETPEDQALHIHSARKRLKRARALLRLIASGLADGAARGIERRIAAAARQLSGARDTHVLEVTVGRLEAIDPPLDKADAAALRRFIGRIRSSASAPDPAAAMEGARAALVEIAAAIDALDLASVPRRAVFDGLIATHRSGRERLEKVETEASDESLHELRKVVQRHWRQMVLLRDVWPEVLAGRVGEARLVSELLGTHNDIAVLARHLAGSPRRAVSAAARTRILTACRRLQADTASEGIERARRLFADEPNSFAEAIAGYWRAARRLARQTVHREEKAKETQTRTRRISPPHRQ